MRMVTQTSHPTRGGGTDVWTPRHACVNREAPETQIKELIGRMYTCRHIDSHPYTHLYHVRTDTQTWGPPEWILQTVNRTKHTHIAWVLSYTHGLLWKYTHRRQDFNHIDHWHATKAPYRHMHTGGSINALAYTDTQSLMQMHSDGDIPTQNTQTQKIFSL